MTINDPFFPIGRQDGLPYHMYGIFHTHTHLGKRPESKSGKPLMVNLRMLPSLPCGCQCQTRRQITGRERRERMGARKRHDSHTARTTTSTHIHTHARHRKNAVNGRAIESGAALLGVLLRSGWAKRLCYYPRALSFELRASTKSM